jgi:hypothetical protein
MKKAKLFFLLTLFAGVIMTSCQKTELADPRAGGDENALVKEDPSDFGLPIYMDQEVYLGYAEITLDAGMIHVGISLDPLLLGDWYVNEAHLYAGEAPPPSSAPGLFPYMWDNESGEPLAFAIPLPEGMGEESFGWYFALHLELEQEVIVDEVPTLIYETAWLLPEEGGTYWYNAKGKKIGWGQYFWWYFSAEPQGLEVSDIVLYTATDPEGTWGEVAGDGSNFEMCLDPQFPWHYFDVDMEVSIPLDEEWYSNQFYLEPVDPVENPGFWAFWDGQGVNEFAIEGTWEYDMYQIIIGNYPMFYVSWDGSDYGLIDGFLMMNQGLWDPLRINGIYPAGTYYFSGALWAPGGIYSETITIGLTVYQCEQ